MSYIVDKPPSEDPLVKAGVREWELPDHRPNLTASRAGYRPYSTTRRKYAAWEPIAKPRQ